MNQPPTRDDSRNRPPDDPARDAWLSEALRHAPDADAAPSVAVRETILRQARAAAAQAAPGRPAGAWQRVNAVWSWLSGPRVAAGFASVMVATIVGLMWWDKPMDETLRRPETRDTAAAPAAAPAPSPAPTKASEQPAATTPAAPSAEPPRDLAAAAPPPPRPAPERRREAAKPRADTANEVRREAAPATRGAGGATGAAGVADEKRALADAAPETTRADRQAQETEGAREQLAETSRAKTAAQALRSTSPAPAAAGSMYVPAPPSAAAAPSPQARPAPLSALLDALADESPRWRWQRGADERAVTPELRAWLQRLDRTVAGRWSGAVAGQEATPTQGHELRLLRDGGVRAIVRLGADGTVRLDVAGETPLAAQLPATSAAALRQALDDATR